jgi:hypothetical protein
MKVLDALFPAAYVAGAPLRVVDFYWVVPIAKFAAAFPTALPIKSQANAVPDDLTLRGYDLRQYVLGVEVTTL